MYEPFGTVKEKSNNLGWTPPQIRIQKENLQTTLVVNKNIVKCIYLTMFLRGIKPASLLINVYPFLNGLS